MVEEKIPKKDTRSLKEIIDFYKLDTVIRLVEAVKILKVAGTSGYWKRDYDQYWNGVCKQADIALDMAAKYWGIEETEEVNNDG